jgi:crotonobetainyl-CoA:carnitine CoA-transferase CaiB-like acyl-CoA transferase
MSGAGLPLDDVKILDFMWVLAGPSATRVLADHGALVVRVESTRRIDTARTLAPFHDGVPGAERSALFHNTNASKRMLTLDPTCAAGRAVVLDLVRWADVVAESFSPDVMQAWQLDYPVLRTVNPDVIMLSTCLMGQTGPWASFAGYGNLAAAISGFSNLGGWADRPPAGPFSAYTDYVSPRFVAVAILAALEYRRRTGRGQYVDLSQAEASLHFLGPALLDYEVNARLPHRVGNDDPDFVPHGVYPTTGRDCWVAIAVDGDEAFARLCDVMERPDLAVDSRFATLAARRTHREALDAEIGSWTRDRAAGAIEEALQARGVPASAVQDSAGLCADAQLAHRGHVLSLPHADLGTTAIEGSRFRLSRTPARLPESAPTYGRDTAWVLGELLGYDEARITELVASGALD